MSKLILGAINKSIANKKYHLKNFNELINILNKKNYSELDRYYLKELYSIPTHILKEKLFKYLNEDEKLNFISKAEEFGKTIKIW